MIFPSKEEFIKLSKHGNLIPVCMEITSDIETPVSAYKKIEGKSSFLLESIEGGEKIARYSFIGSSPSLVIKGGDDPFKVLKKILGKYKPVKVPNLPRFHGGLVGYISYDAVRFVENIPDKNPDDLKLPLYYFLFADTVLAFDHLKHSILVISNAFVKKSPARAYDVAIKKIEKLVSKLKNPSKADILKNNKTSLDLKSNISKKEFEGIVKAAKGYIGAGDVIQVVLSQRFETKFNKDPFDVYRRLRSINPSPYMYYLNLGKTKIIGASPEVMVRLEGRKATLRPIAGTRKRGTTSEQDKILENELLADKKEVAEHIMLVDLGRNDLGRVCEKGSVVVTKLMSIEKYSHVMHIVSNVEGKLKKGLDAFDLLRATFPAGTVTGAPKIRAMEIIDCLESARRGPYAGIVGYFGFSGELDSCITIRTIVIDKGKAYIQAGAGIVADSIPDKEYEESKNKAAALFKALRG